AYAGSNVFNVDIAKDYRIIGVAALSPITVLHNYKYEYSDLAKIDTYPLFNDKSEASPERRMTSPINYINEKTPPTILFAGTADTLVKCNSSVVLHEELNEYGVSSKLVLSKGGGHCFEKVNDNDNVSVSFDKVQELTAEFAMGVLTDSNKVFD
ncbi:MAG: prolyl oligopeptidase family serine peptidase, partial [Clostridia bacterium]|nr:prolyl oligopeptidase family serine peptidase [Clostridia bacterium]